MSYSILLNLIHQIGLVTILAFLMTNFPYFRNFFYKTVLTFPDYLFLIILFGLIGILGTYEGIPVQGALANYRVIGPFVGGLIGGPLVGIGAGLLSGFHRWAIDIGGFTAFACMVSTIIEGLLAGLLSRKFYELEKKWLFALLGGIIAESMQMGILLILVKPFDEALNLVKIIAFPMIFANAAGISIFAAIVDIIFRQRDEQAALSAQNVLKIVGMTLPFLRTGLRKDTAAKVVDIIYKNLDVDAVSMTDTVTILAHSGRGRDHHTPGSGFQTALTETVIKTGKFRIAHNREMIGCKNRNCPLFSAITVPLKIENRTVGTLKLYKSKKSKINQADLETSLGLASIFSIQLELSMIEKQKKNTKDAEFKALQSQINPHFLFNAINTIVSFIRTDPEEGRRLLLKLGDVFRNNLNQTLDMIPVHREIEHLDSWLEIEKARFGEMLEVVYDVDVPDAVIPVLLLQPLVENSLKHGIGKKLGKGKITISVKKDVSCIRFSVEDNGAGFDRETLSSFENGKLETIGLTNTDERLRNRYGEESGLKILCPTGGGTLVEFLIPEENNGI